MPQMAPLWWETLFLLFIIMFMFMNMIIYYNKTVAPKYNKKHNQKYQFKWKW
nr:ATP synthase subunit 8 [Zicca taeniola]